MCSSSQLSLLISGQVTDTACQAVQLLKNLSHDCLLHIIEYYYIRYSYVVLFSTVLNILLFSTYYCCYSKLFKELRSHNCQCLFMHVSVLNNAFDMSIGRICIQFGAFKIEKQYKLMQQVELEFGR